MQQRPNNSNNGNYKRNHAQAFSQSQLAQALNHAMNLPPHQYPHQQPLMFVSADTLNSAGSSSTSSSRISHSPPEQAAAAAVPSVKPEPSDPETTPQNPAEASAFRELLAMQFQDRREILQAYRKLLAQKGGTTPPSVDEVMMYLITQREEAEEAAKMDAARLASERSRKHDAEERRAELRRQLQNDMERATVAKWRTDERMFVHSWLLENAELCRVVEEQLQLWKQTNSNANAAATSPLKLELIQLLQLEKKARQWYRATLPKAYFGGPVTDRLLRASFDDRLLEQVRREIQTLHTGLYELEHQVGGVPVIFRDAHDDAAENNDDDEVLVVKTTNNGRAADPAGAEEETNEPSLPNPNQAPAAAPDIVDIT